jgi:hypothetical protein
MAELRDLEIREISGVDHPANLFEGWLVLKSRDGGQPVGTDALAEFQQLYEQATEVTKQQEQLLAAIVGAEALLSTAPATVQRAAQTIREFLEALAAEDQAPDAAAAGAEAVAAEDSEPEPARNSLLRTLSRLMGRDIAKAEDETDEDEQEDDELDEQTVKALCERIAGREEAAA